MKTKRDDDKIARNEEGRLKDIETDMGNYKDSSQTLAIQSSVGLEDGLCTKEKANKEMSQCDRCSMDGQAKFLLICL